DYRWALLDRRLMQQWLSTPAIWKYAAGTGRYLHRRAISGVVPDKVAWKPTKDMTLGDHEPPVQAAPDTDAALHPLLAELLDERRWREPADERGLPPANPLNLRPWRRAADINDWLTTRGPSGL
ncbi:MAG: hypothetical protein JWO76_852, partial [Nocardioides sp.]|nr:hypothetical protein [Nocardioides sp.]